MVTASNSRAETYLTRIAHLAQDVGGVAPPEGNLIRVLRIVVLDALHPRAVPVLVDLLLRIRRGLRRRHRLHPTRSLGIRAVIACYSTINFSSHCMTMAPSLGISPEGYEPFHRLVFVILKEGEPRHGPV